MPKQTDDYSSKGLEEPREEEEEDEEEEEEVMVTDRLLEHLEKFALDQRLSDPRISIRNGSKSGDNYVGVVYRVAIEGEKNGRTTTIRAIVKTMPAAGARAPRLREQMFTREIYFYREILPAFQQILAEYNMRLEYCPRLYATSEEPGDETLILEDLKYEGFRMNSSKMLNYEELSLTIRCVAQFHACSFVGRLKRPDLLEPFKHLTDMLFRHSNGNLDINESKTFSSKLLSSLVAEALENEDSHYTERHRLFAENFEKHMIDVTDGSKAEPYAVVNHGDVWTNNILFKYESTGKDSNDCETRVKPVALKLLDYQVCRYTSPVLDLVYLLYCSCPSWVRRENYERLLREYYDCLSDVLKRCDCNPEEVYPWDVFRQHLKRFGKFAGGMATYVMHLFLSNNGESLSFNEAKLREKLRKDHFYRETLRDVFVDLIDRDCI